MKKTIVFSLLLVLVSSLLLAGGTPEERSVKEMHLFTDSLGRSVEIPINPEKIAPSGNVAQLALYALAPEKLSGWSSKLSTEAKSLFLSEVKDKPVFGTFYGKKANLNMEALMTSGSELVIDVGNIKGSKEDMASEIDKLSEMIGLPVIFIAADSIEDYPAMLRTLGEITGDTERAEKLSSFAKDALDYGKKLKNELKPVSVYYSPSEDGLEAVEKGSSHSETLDYIGADNVVPITFSSSNGQVSLESLYLWDPEVILFASPEAYENALLDGAWSILSAVKNKRVYTLSANPYPLIDRPPSTQRLLGIYYLGYILYNDEQHIMDKTIEFYNLFYHKEIDRNEVPSLLGLN